MIRDAAGLAFEIHALHPFAANSDPALVALLIAFAALRRPGSVGSHWRIDSDGSPSMASPLTAARHWHLPARCTDLL